MADHANLLNYYSDDIFMASSGGGFAYHEAEDYSETEKYDFEKNLLGIGVTPILCKVWLRDFQEISRQLLILSKIVE